MAVGLGRFFGLRLPENFNQPYLARNVRDFWRRWHMTLSEFFRDFVYIPLGGSRHGESRTYVNLILV
jgi:alginate O-acetyltransferase complex protein AlgI